MKIYIVQNGDTLFLLAKNNEIELTDLIESNPQLSNPNMLMPGMKIMIPTNKKKINLVDEKKEEQILEPMKRPIGQVEADDDKANRFDDLHLPLYPVVPIGEEAEVQNKEDITKEHKEHGKVEEIAYTREEGGMRDATLEERPLMSPPQHRMKFSICCHCHQPIYQQKQD